MNSGRQRDGSKTEGRFFRPSKTDKTDKTEGRFFCPYPSFKTLSITALLTPVIRLNWRIELPFARTRIHGEVMAIPFGLWEKCSGHYGRSISLLAFIDYSNNFVSYFVAAGSREPRGFPTAAVATHLPFSS